MASRPQGLVRLVSGFGTYLAIALAGSGVIHVAVLAVDAYFVTEPVPIDPRSDFLGAAFSGLMLPVFGAYGALCLVVYRLWNRARKAALATHALEVQRASERAAAVTLQKTAGVLVERIAMHNNRIGHWLERRRASGKAPEEVEASYRRIADTLRSLTEISFMDPHRDIDGWTPQEIEARLLQRLDGAQPAAPGPGEPAGPEPAHAAAATRGPGDPPPTQSRRT